MKRFCRLVATATFMLATGSMLQGADNAAYIRQHYTKYEYRVAMRDGVKLFTSVYVPKDKSKAYPIVLKRTPYSVAPYGLENYVENPGRQRMRYFQEGYIMAFQDVRGRYMSEGTFVNVRPYIPEKRSKTDIDETTDTYDTVDWLVNNVPGNNGRVGISGISYPGFYTSMGIIDAHPAVKVASPQAPVSKWMGGDDWFHNGAFLLSHAFNFYSRFGHPRTGPKSEPDPRFDFGTSDGYEFYLDLEPLPNADARYLKGHVAFWEQLMTHGTWDTFWEARDILPRLRNIQPAVMVVGGWFDTENLYGALHSYASIEEQNPDAFNVLVMGPWSHGEWSRTDGRRLGDIDFGSPTAEFYTEHIELPLFNHYLKDAPMPDLAEAMVFDTGAKEWRYLDSWPPKGTEERALYFGKDGQLGFEPPRSRGAAYDQYVSDPSKPVPYTSEITQWYDASFMLEDQRFAARRPDVLVYETAPLTESVSVAGPIAVDLTVSTSGTDSDWIVKLIDVFPDDTPASGDAELGGYQMLVRGDAMRGKFRNGLAHPEPFIPNEVTTVSFTLEDGLHTFQKGHRIMVQVQSTWFPMFDINPQTFVDIFHAEEKDFQQATERVYHTSHLRIHVMP